MTIFESHHMPHWAAQHQKYYSLNSLHNRCSYLILGHALLVTVTTHPCCFNTTDCEDQSEKSHWACAAMILPIQCFGMRPHIFTHMHFHNLTFHSFHHKYCMHYNYAVCTHYDRYHNRVNSNLIWITAKQQKVNDNVFITGHEHDNKNEK